VRQTCYNNHKISEVSALVCRLRKDLKERTFEIFFLCLCVERQVIKLESPGQNLEICEILLLPGLERRGRYWSYLDSGFRV
jgi:hypothetical protein